MLVVHSGLVGKMSKKVRINVSLSEFEYQRLGIVAERLGVSRALVLSVSWSYAAGVFESVDPLAPKSSGLRNTSSQHDAVFEALWSVRTCSCDDAQLSLPFFGGVE